MRVLVTGGGGMLAQAVSAEFTTRGADVLALTRAELDVTSRDAVRDRVASDRPDLVVQCAAYTAVDAAEAHPERAYEVNATATEHVAAACEQIGSLLVYPSTDYVFRGDGSRPYRPDDPTEPINTYGRSKEAGERAALAIENAIVVRTSWLYGGLGHNFVRTVLHRARQNASLRIVDDQVGRPTWTGCLAAVMADLSQAHARGIYHASDAGEPTSWHGFATEVLRLAGLSADVAPISTADRPTAAERPAYSVLDCATTESVLGRPLPDWRVNLQTHLRCVGGAV